MWAAIFVGPDEIYRGAAEDAYDKVREWLRNRSNKELDRLDTDEMTVNELIRMIGG